LLNKKWYGFSLSVLRNMREITGKEFPIPNADTLMHWNAIYGHGKWVSN
jgi:hypothetical protein